MIHHEKEKMDICKIVSDNYEKDCPLEWYREFVDNLDKENMLKEMIKNAQFLELEPLMELCAMKIARKLMPLEPNEIKKYFDEE